MVSISRKRKTVQKRRKSIKSKIGGRDLAQTVYVLYVSLIINQQERFEIAYIANSMNSALQISSDIIVNMVNPDYRRRLLPNGNDYFFVHTLTKNINRQHQVMEIIEIPMDEQPITDGEDTENLYFLRGQNGIIECIYDNLDLARNDFPNRQFEQLQKNVMNWNSIMFQ